MIRSPRTLPRIKNLVRICGSKYRLVALMTLIVLSASGAVITSSTSFAKRSREVKEAQASTPNALPPTGQGKRGDVEVAAQGESIPQQERGERKPRELRLNKTRRSFDGDLRSLPRRRPAFRERRELEEPALNPRMYVPPGGVAQESKALSPAVVAPPGPSAPAPAPNNVFEGLDRFNWGAGSPPDTNGDVGPTYYIQTVNTSIGIFRKSDGGLQTALTFDTFMSQGSFGNLCDTNNFGDPVVLYDTFEDRWIISDFAFLTDISGNVLAPAYQCVAASKTSDPVAGGWNYYSIQLTDGLNDYPKFGIWPDGLYMSANMFTFGAGSSYKSFRAWAFNKAQMYAGKPTVQIVAFDLGSSDFTVVPSNARLQVGTPPPGRPNLYVSTWNFLNALTVYKFHVDWDRISLSTFTGPDVPLAATSWPNAAVGNAPQSGTGTLLDVLQIRAMVQNQYTNLSGVESLWVPHTVRRANTTGFAAPRWYQVDVTGGTVAANLPQATTWDPDGANVIYRFMPSLAVDRAGNMALGYSTSSSTTFPSMAYAGRLAGDPVNTFSQTEQTMFTGTGSQTGTTRWGDYSAMTLDPNGCTFWYTNEYANPADQTFNHRWLTKFGSFGPFTGCTPFGAGGTISGTVTTNPGGAPIQGATVSLGNRTTTTNGSGNYSFTSIPAGTYPGMTASKPGNNSASASSIAVTDGNTTTQNFSLTAAPASCCFTDTTQSDFQTGVGTTVDLNTSPGDVTLANTPTVDQQNTAGTTTGTGFGTPNWTGQTFIAGVTGQLVKADVTLFCSGCGATPPNLTLSVRATSGGLPTGADLDSATIPGSTFASGASVTYTASFGAPATLTSGTQYALVLRPVSAPAGSGYFWIRSSPSTYANGSRVLSADSGGTWSADTTRDFNFKTYMQTGYAASGNQISSAKDANPASGTTPNWTTLSWNATVPANTNLQFQVAASNDAAGVFNFVGPDSTAGTFFTTSGASLSQFNGFRYLKYKAFLTTSNGAVTPTVNDVTVCFNNIAATDLTVAKSHVGNFTQGDTGKTYTITVSNTGSGASSGMVTLTDNLPAGLRATAWGGSGWNNCTATPVTGPAVLTCNRSDSVAGGGGSYPSLTLTVDVLCSAAASVTNSATVSGGGDSNGANNTANDPTTINPDTIPPAITCPAGVTKFADSGQNGASINPGVPVATDNCGNVTITGARSDGKPLNALYPIGMTLINWTAKDAAGNTAGCAQTIVVMAPSGPRRIPGEEEESLLATTELLVAFLLSVW